MQINVFAIVITKIHGLNRHYKSSLVLFEQFHHFSSKFSCRNSIENFAMVKCKYSVHITMEDFRVKYCVLREINGFGMVIRKINGFNWH